MTQHASRQRQIAADRTGGARAATARALRSTQRLFAGTTFALALEPGTSSTWVQISKAGTWKGHMWGEFDLSRKHFDSAIAQFSKQENELVFDYEHASLFGGGIYGAPASGWSSQLELRGDAGAEELWALVEFTARAADAIRAKEYRYTSPVWCFSTPDRVTGETVIAELHSVALTNVPFLDGMAPVELSLSRRRSFALASAGAGGSMDPEEQIQAVRDALGLESSATIDDIKAFLDGLDKLAKAKSGEGGGAAEEDPPADPADDPAGMRRPKPKPAGETSTAAERVLSNRVEELEKREEQREEQARAARVEAVIASGRALPGEREDLLELARDKPKLFEKIEKRTPIAPLNRVTTEDPSTNESNELTPREQTFYRMYEGAALTDPKTGKPMTKAQLRAKARADAAKK